MVSFTEKKLAFQLLTRYAQYETKKNSCGKFKIITAFQAVPLNSMVQMKKNISILLVQLGIFFLYASLAAAAKQPALMAIQFTSPTVDKDRIIFKLNGSYLPKTFSIMGEKPRVIFDFPLVKPAPGVKSSINTDGHFIKRIRMALHSGKKLKTRVVFDLQTNQPVHFDQHLNKVDHVLVITVYAGGNKSKPKAAVNQPEPAPPQVKVEADDQTGPAVTPESSTKVRAAKIPQKVKQEPAANAPVEPELTQKSPVWKVRRFTPPPPVLMAKPELLHAAQPETKTAAPQPKVQKTEQNQVREALLKKPLRDHQKPNISSIEFDNSTNRGEIIRFKLNGFHPPVVNAIKEDIPRVICFFKEGGASEPLPKLIKTRGRYVTAIRTNTYHNPDNIRVIVDLAPGNNYDLRQVFFKKNTTFMLIINSDDKVSSQKTKTKQSNTFH